MTAIFYLLNGKRMSPNIQLSEKIFINTCNDRMFLKNMREID